MRELDTIAKQELKNGIAMLVREYSAELIDDYMNYFENLNV